MKRGPHKRVHIAMEELDMLKGSEKLYFWEQIELEFKKMYEAEETPEEREKRMREPTFAETVVEILYHYDLMNFAKYGFPEDEYDIEAYPIVYNLHRVDDIASLRWLVYEVFAWKFSETSVPQSGDVRYRYIAEEIWEEWQQRIARADAQREREIKMKIKKLQCGKEADGCS